MHPFANSFVVFLGLVILAGGAYMGYHYYHASESYPPVRRGFMLFLIALFTLFGLVLMVGLRNRVVSFEDMKEFSRRGAERASLLAMKAQRAAEERTKRRKRGKMKKTARREKARKEGWDTEGKRVRV